MSGDDFQELEELMEGNTRILSGDEDEASAAPEATPPDEPTAPAATEEETEERQPATSADEASDEPAPAKETPAGAETEEPKPEGEPEARTEETTPEKSTDRGKPIYNDGTRDYYLEDLKDPDTYEKLQAALRDGTMLKSTFTQKRMADAATARAAQARAEAVETLAVEIATNDRVQEYLAEFGETARRALFANPEAALRIVRDEGQVEKLWREAAALRENPGLAARMREAGEAQAAREELAQIADQQELVSFGETLLNVVGQAAEAFPDVDRRAIGTFIAGLAGLPPNAAPEDLYRSEGALKRLRSILVIEQREVDPNTGREVTRRYVDPRLIVNQFQALDAARTRSQTAAAEAAASHNKETLEALEANPPPPTGGAPGGSGNNPGSKPIESYDDAMGELESLVEENARVLAERG